jgi:hypothetical protein
MKNGLKEPREPNDKQNDPPLIEILEDGSTDD